MPNTLDLANIIDFITDKWEQTSGSVLDQNAVIKTLIQAVLHVENFDFPNNVSYSVSNDQIEFTDPIPVESAMLYIYKSLMILYQSDVSQKVSDNEIGISWKSGMESMSTSGAGKVSQQIMKEFKDDYIKSLSRAKIKNMSATSIDLY